MYLRVKIAHGVNFYVIYLLFDNLAYKTYILKNTLNGGVWNITYEKVFRKFSDPSHFAIESDSFLLQIGTFLFPSLGGKLPGGGGGGHFGI